MMEFLIPSKKISKCSKCKGSGYIPLKNKKVSQNSNYTIEIGCEECKGKGKITKRVDLSLESLKDLLK